MSLPSSSAGRRRSGRIRVGVVTTSFPILSGSSSGIFVERLLSHLPAEAAATVLVPCCDREVGQGVKAPYELRCFRYAPRTWQRLAHVPGGIPDAIRRQDPVILLIPFFLSALYLGCLRLASRVDVIHGNWSIPAIVAALAARPMGIPSIATLRGEDVTRVESSILFRWLLGLCLRINQAVVVVSEAMRKRLVQRFPWAADRIIFIPNGVELGADRERRDLHQPLRLLSVGSLIARKRLDTLVHAIALLPSDVGITLRLVGDGPQAGALVELAQRLDVFAHVELIGAVPPQEIQAHLDWADIFLFASESEGRPNAVLEAMAAGLPVVATDIPGVRELVGAKTGLRVPVGDARAFADAILRLAGNAQAVRAMGCAGRSAIIDAGPTWSAAGRRYAQLYSNVLETARVP